MGSGRRIGTAEIKVLGEMVRHYESLQRRFGGGQVRDRVVRFVHDEARVAAEATYSEQHGRELFSTLAQATWLAGLTTADSGRHALGQRYYAQALHLATQAGDTLFAANVLAEMSRLTIDIGNATSQATGAEHAPMLGTHGGTVRAPGVPRRCNRSPTGGTREGDRGQRVRIFLRTSPDRDALRTIRHFSTTRAKPRPPLGQQGPKWPR
ncbi:hypothetical protein [Actinoalloteichus sp. AHMU CJ021]|uniref:hypothetical protein n=1 Tax=Actinoalloteichus sp. AHMU CJ021 TaxID=2072503 RepID=UPI0026A63A28